MGTREKPALSRPAARRRVVAFGGLSAVGAASLALVPVGWSVVPLAGLLLGFVGLGWSMAGLKEAQDAHAHAQRARLWPWMAGSPLGRASADLLASLSLLGYHPVAGGGVSVPGKGRRVFWEWAQVRLADGPPPSDKNGAAVPVQEAWALRLVWRDGRPLGWGDLRKNGLGRPAHQQAAISTPAPLPNALVLHGNDSVATLRAWNPVALEVLSGLPASKVLGVHSAGSEGVVVVPRSWIEGPDTAAFDQLVGALREATGKDRWDATVGQSWHPQVARASDA